MGLFDKKICDICGEKIGLLGNRKLDDGNLCKDCAKKLSPWFEERRHSTVEDIKRQLEYREKNKKEITKCRWNFINSNGIFNLKLYLLFRESLHYFFLFFAETLISSTIFSMELLSWLRCIALIKRSFSSKAVFTAFRSFSLVSSSSWITML